MCFNKVVLATRKLYQNLELSLCHNMTLAKPVTIKTETRKSGLPLYSNNDQFPIKLKVIVEAA